MFWGEFGGVSGVGPVEVSGCYFPLRIVWMGFEDGCILRNVGWLQMDNSRRGRIHFAVWVWRFQSLYSERRGYRNKK